MRIRRLLLLAAVVTVACVVGAVAGGLAAWTKLKDDTPPVTAETVVGLRHLPDGSYSYVVSNNEIRVYDIGHSHTLVKKIVIPDRFAMWGIHGVAAHAPSNRLYVGYGGDNDELGYVSSRTTSWRTRCLEPLLRAVDRQHLDHSRRAEDLHAVR